MNYKQLLADLTALNEENPAAMNQDVTALIDDRLNHLELVTNLTQSTIILIPVFTVDGAENATSDEE